MSIDLFGLIEEPKEKEENAEKPKAKNKTAKAQKETKTTDSAKTTEKAVSGKKTKEKKKDKKVKETKYTYPFNFYTEGREVDITSYGFEEGKEYTENEITKIMLDHRHYEFAGEMTYSLIKDDNMLVATAKQFKKG